MFRVLFYIGVLIATYYLLKWIFKNIGSNAHRLVTQRRISKNREATLLENFVKDTGTRCSLAHMKSALSADQVEKLLGQKGFVGDLIKHAGFKNFQEIIGHTHAGSSVSEEDVIIALEHGPEFLDFLIKVCGQERIDDLMRNSLPYQCVRGNLGSVKRMVEGHMSGARPSSVGSGKSLLWYALRSGKVEIVNELARLGGDAVKSSTPGHEFLDACESASPEIIDAVFRMKVNRTARDKDGNTYLDKLIIRDLPKEFLIKYSKLLKSDKISFDLNKHKSTLEKKGLLEEFSETLQLPDDVRASPVAVVTNQRQAHRLIILKQYFQGLIGYEGIRVRLENDLGAWFGASPKTRLILCWGSSGNGKTELALRLSGLRPNFTSLDDFEHTFYFAPTLIHSVAEVLKHPTSSLVIVDDFHTICDSNSSLAYSESTHKSFLVGLKTILGLSQNYWIFLINTKGDSAPSREDINRFFGEDIARDVDFVEWKLPQWGVAELAAYAASRPKVLDYFDEDGIAKIVSRLHKKGFGAKEVEKIILEVSHSGSLVKLDDSQIEKILEQIGA